MIRSMKLKRARGLAVILALMAMILCGGCGNDGRSHSGLAQQPGPQDPAVTGVVRAPNGRLTAVDRLIRWAKDFSLISSVNAGAAFPALFHAEPVGIGTLVVASRVSPFDAADGEIDTPDPISEFPHNGGVPTNAGGVYALDDRSLYPIDQCRLMVTVGSNDGSMTKMRAFVYQRNTDIDPASEAMVRVILDRITKAPVAELCDFSTAGLREIELQVRQVAATAEGPFVFEMVEDAYRLASDSDDVQEAISRALAVNN